MNIVWRDVRLPEFGHSDEPPIIPAEIYEQRCRRAYERANADWFIVYGDREHSANMAYLTAFDPRFEEALLLLGPADRRVLVVGNEGLGYSGMARPALDVALCQSLSLMGQDRGIAPRLTDVLRAAGIARGQRLALAGWKYLEREETDDDLPGFFAPAMLVDTLRRLAGDPAAVVDATAVLMHPTSGLRAHNEVEQIAAFEWMAARATRAVERVVQSVRPGMGEMDAVANMGFAGEMLTAHVMFTTGRGEIVGLRSPTMRRVERGDAATVGIGYVGGLCCRAGLVQDSNPEFLSAAAIPYFRGLAAWYQTVGLGVDGGTIVERVRDALAEGGLRSMLNPGHLSSLEEWLHSPVRPGSTEPITSGMAFQSDIIPTPLPAGWAINCEDPVVFADGQLRGEIEQRYPDLWSRLRARQHFMRQELGLQVGDEVLPLSTMPAYLMPLWLSPTHVLTVV